MSVGAMENWPVVKSRVPNRANNSKEAVFIIGDIVFERKYNPQRRTTSLHDAAVLVFIFSIFYGNVTN